MTKFYDIRLKEYIFSKNFRNVSFKEFLEFHDDYVTSADSTVLEAEKTYFAWQKYESIEDNIEYSQEFIFNMESKLLKVLADIEMA